ncbi:hypothetical protein FIBSPDRAFT_1049676 [Athelia psychrophila]|uniref:Uncharacterized protein n=1 Tax=Athelia psychrophila TaxID=1759441 RepID=A0A166BYM0_9AGAM|nr:hypothetical protein FIBSPDRAFT_1049676 [Fibularhizoctonia sp. CBS 109695]
MGGGNMGGHRKHPWSALYGGWKVSSRWTDVEDKRTQKMMRLGYRAAGIMACTAAVFSNGLGYALKLGAYKPEYMVDHFNAKGRVSDWLQAQPSVVDDSAPSWSVVNTCLYYEMLNHILPARPTEQARGRMSSPLRFKTATSPLSPFKTSDTSSDTLSTTALRRLRKTALDPQF